MQHNSISLSGYAGKCNPSFTTIVHLLVNDVMDNPIDMLTTTSKDDHYKVAKVALFLIFVNSSRG